LTLSTPNTAFITLSEESVFEVESVLPVSTKHKRVFGEAGKQKLLMTLFFVSLDLSSGEVHYLNAGHNSPSMQGDADAA